jgi:hypothetical protein
LFRQICFRFPAKDSVIDRPSDGVFNIPEISRRPNGDVENEPLPLRTLGFSNPDSRENFQLFDMNLMLGPGSH